MDQQTKQCTGKCGEIKPLSEFGKDRCAPDGLTYQCKICRSKKSLAWAESNKEHVKKTKADWYKDNRDIEIKRSKKYAAEHKEEKTKYGKEYRENNKDKISQYQKEYDRIRSKTQTRQNYKREYEKKQKEHNINYRLSCILRIRLNHVLAGDQKTGSAVSDLGCSIEFLKQRLETMFYDDKNGKQMTWENQGEWHIDHIIPLSYFNLANRGAAFDCL